MLGEFVIHYEGTGRDASRRALRHDFGVTLGDEEAIIRVWLTDPLLRVWGAGGPCGAELIGSPRPALRYLKDHLAAADALSYHEILITAGDLAEHTDERTIRPGPKQNPYQRKECRHRVQRQGEHYCLKAGEDDDWGGRTTLAVCEGCSLPSTDVACSNLVHPATRSSRSFGQPQTRQLWDINCDIGHGVDEGSAAECVPGGRDCWVQTYTPDREAEAAERHPAADALELIDTLNIIFRDQFGIELFRLKQFRTGRVMLEPCNTEEAFAHKLQVLGDLIDLINSKELGEAQGLKSDGGSINWLVAFLDKVAPGEAPPVIQTLRDIKTLRKHVAAHSATADHFVDASGRLGIGQPIADWNQAWSQVIDAFLHALRKLQALLP